ncbi:hypothetical protein [Butyrivibrio sp. X503]|uniref:hypothetical protein n=1 Tax=Butyrivibrio sp. X503 TaxID=2364878 RepID=UPI0011C24081|nr:hypothetical protein [Butyrivibrio sp. X503]
MREKIVNVLLRYGVAMAVVLMPFTAAASTDVYYVSNQHGAKGICYCEDSITWRVTDNEITSVDKNQKVDGLFVNAKGIEYEAARSNAAAERSYLAKKQFIAGAVLGGVTIGYSKDINDRMVIYRNGNARVDREV